MDRCVTTNNPISQDFMPVQLLAASSRTTAQVVRSGSIDLNLIDPISLETIQSRVNQQPSPIKIIAVTEVQLSNGRLQEHIYAGQDFFSWLASKPTTSNSQLDVLTNLAMDHVKFSIVNQTGSSKIYSEKITLTPQPLFNTSSMLMLNLMSPPRTPQHYDVNLSAFCQLQVLRCGQQLRTQSSLDARDLQLLSQVTQIMLDTRRHIGTTSAARLESIAAGTVLNLANMIKDSRPFESLSALDAYLSSDSMGVTQFMEQVSNTLKYLEQNNTLASATALAPTLIPQVEAPAKCSPLFQIRALCTQDTIRVYQAFNHHIADAALASNRLTVPGFSDKRMTWIKPSLAWLMHRSDYAQKNNQERILGIDIPLHLFLKLLENSIHTHQTFETSQSHDYISAKDKAQARVQWDPERDVAGHRIPQTRSIQIGIQNEALKAYASEWITHIEDVTPLVQQIHQLVKQGNIEQAQQLYPGESVVSLDNIQNTSRFIPTNLSL